MNYHNTACITIFVREEMKTTSFQLAVCSPSTTRVRVEKFKTFSNRSGCPQVLRVVPGVKRLWDRAENGKTRKILTRNAWPQFDDAGGVTAILKIDIVIIILSRYSVVGTDSRIAKKKRTLLGVRKNKKDWNRLIDYTWLFLIDGHVQMNARKKFRKFRKYRKDIRRS